MELLVGNRLQAVVRQYGVTSFIGGTWGVLAHAMWVLRNATLLLFLRLWRSAAMQRLVAELRLVWQRVREFVTELVGDRAPLLREGAIQLGLFCGLMCLNPMYAIMHAVSIFMKAYAEARR